jgi:anti-sigma factor RsiW
VNVKAECENLDAYLADELSFEAASQFVQHLGTCEECRYVADEQRWIDGLLRSDVSATLESAPAALVESLRDAAVVHRRRRAYRIVGSLAAVAAVIVVAVGSTILFNSQTERIAASVGASQDATLTPETEVVPAVAPDSVLPKAVFVGTDEAIAVPFESSDDNVTVVQLYPTTDTERRLQRELAFQSFESDANGG